MERKTVRSGWSAVHLGVFAGLAILTSACGGSGGGVGLASTPPPPPPPALTASPLLPGTKSSLTPTVLANAGRSPIASGPTVVVPLTFTAIAPPFLSDPATMDQGASLAIGGSVPPRLTVPRIGITDIANGGKTDNTLAVIVTINESLDYTRFGHWKIISPDPIDDGGWNTSMAVFSGGLETPVANIPTNGSASYSGDVLALYDGRGTQHNIYALDVRGNVQLSANFSEKTLSGLMTQLFIQSGPQNSSGFMNDVSFAVSFGSLQNLFSGTTAVASMPGSPFALGPNASGTIVGSFYGPRAQEIGAVWTLSDGARRVIGSFGAKTGN